MIDAKSLNRRFIVQFATVVLPFLVLLLYQTAAEVERTAELKRLFELHSLADAAKDRYGTFLNGAADAADTGALSRPARAALAEAAGLIGQTRDASGGALFAAEAAACERLVHALAADASLARLQGLRQDIDAVREQVAVTETRLQEQLDAAIREGIGDSRRLTVVVSVVSLLVLTATLLFIVRTARGLSGPLGTAVAVAERIAEGQPIDDLPIDGGPDIGSLLATLRRMYLSLQRYRAEVADYQRGLEDKIRQLADSRTRLADAQRSARLGNWQWNRDSGTVYWSDEMYRILGLEAGACEPSLQTFLSALDPRERDALADKFATLARAPCEIVHEHGIGPAGSERIVHHCASSQADAQGRVSHLHGTLQDVTERKRAEQQIRQLALYDSLTGLPNRQYFKEQLAAAVEQARRAAAAGARGGAGLATLFIDLDRFKRINDTLGHSVGDQLLQEAARRLTDCLRAGDVVCAGPDAPASSTVSRLGGDEFTVMLSGLPAVDQAGAIAARLLDALSRPFRIADSSLVVTASIGIAAFPEGGDDADALMRNADTAMYQAKQQGKNTYRFFTEGMGASVFERLTLEGELHHAIERDQLVLHYQPKVDFHSGRIVGAEALIRWHHPKWGMVPPGRFIPVAEETGLILPISDWVLDRACQDLARWREAGLGEPSVAVNLASPSFRRVELVDQLGATFQRYGIAPGRIELEMTESMLMQDVDATLRTLARLRELGVRISIDDFGTGYSSLSYLRRFPISQLKIDRSFVREMTFNDDDASITAAIISLALSLKLEVIAEGVETLQQAELLHRQGCHLMQGFLFSQPVAAPRMAEWLRKGAIPGVGQARGLAA